MVGAACSQLLLARHHLQLGLLLPLTLPLLCQHHCCSEACSQSGAAFFGRLQSLQLLETGAQPAWLREVAAAAAVDARQDFACCS